jgi:PEP-CTERM motif
MSRLVVMSIAVILPMLGVSTSRADGIYSYSTALNGATDGSLTDNTGQIVFQATSSTFGVMSGSGMAMFQVLNHIVTPAATQDSSTANAGASSTITIVVSDGMGDSGTITVGDSTTGTFSSAESAVVDALKLESSATFNIGAAAFTFLGFFKATLDGGTTANFDYAGNGTSMYTSPLLAEFSYVGLAIVVPEPTSALLATLGLAGVAVVGVVNRRRRGASRSA